MKILLLILMFAPFAMLHAWPGKKSYGKETVQSLDIVGSVSLEGTIVKKLAKVVGSLTAQGAQIEQLDAVGNISLTDTTINKRSSLVGKVNFYDCNVKQDLSICSDNIFISGSHVSTIYVPLLNTGYEGTQTLQLSNGTVVEGSVIFEGKNGMLVLEPGSRVLGSIEGASDSKQSL